MHIIDLCEERAPKGDGAFASAPALHLPVREHQKVAGKSGYRGFDGPADEQGALEKAALALEKLAAVAADWDRYDG